MLVDKVKYAEVLALLEPAQVATTAALGENHVCASTTCRVMALPYNAQGRYAESLAQLARRLAVVLETKGEGHPDVAIVRSYIASVRALQEEAVGKMIAPPQAGGRWGDQVD